MSKMWLIGGLVLVVALAVGAVVTALVTSRSGADLPADSPEGVVQRYLLAVQREDYQKAHSYLTADLRRRCRVEEFASRSYWPYADEDDEITLEKTLTFDGTAVVMATVTFHHDPILFGSSGYSYDKRFELELEDGQWRLTVPGGDWPGRYCPWF